MFKSKLRPIVIPQSEHAKLAGTLALLWGNTSFDLPETDWLSFIAGVGLHDRGYGYLDTSAIDEMPFERRSNEISQPFFCKFEWRTTYALPIEWRLCC